MEAALATEVHFPMKAVEAGPPTAAFDMPASVVKSAGRAIQILEFFDLIQREACVSEISTALRYPQSSTSVLLRSLVAMGYLQHNRLKRTYFPTRRVSLLGSWVDPTLVQHGALLELAHNVSNDSGETVVMATVNGLNAQYIYEQRALASESRAPIAIGATRSLARTAVGAALLSVFDDIHVGKVLRRINAERRPCEQPIEISAFISSLSAGRKRGYFIGVGVNHDDIAVATIVDRNKEGELLVIAVEGPSKRLTDHIEDVAQCLRTAVSNFKLTRRPALG